MTFVMFKVSGQVILGHAHLGTREYMVNVSCDSGDLPLTVSISTHLVSGVNIITLRSIHD